LTLTTDAKTLTVTFKTAPGDGAGTQLDFVTLDRGKGTITAGAEGGKPGPAPKSPKPGPRPKSPKPAKKGRRIGAGTNANSPSLQGLPRGRFLPH